MARTLGTYSLSANIEMLAGAPLDAREIVPAKADLTTSGMFPYAYIGMETYVVAENKKYRLIGIDPTVPTNWEEATGGSDIVQGYYVDGHFYKYPVVEGSYGEDGTTDFYTLVDYGYMTMWEPVSNPQTNTIYYDSKHTPHKAYMWTGSAYTDQVSGEITGDTRDWYVDLTTKTTYYYNGSAFVMTVDGTLMDKKTYSMSNHYITSLSDGKKFGFIDYIENLESALVTAISDHATWVSGLVTIPAADHTYDIIDHEVIDTQMTPASHTVTEWVSNLNTAFVNAISDHATWVSGKLDKTTYEYNKEINFGSSGKLLIGKFPCYDSNVTITISSATSVTYHCTAILATQNINTSGGGVFKWETYGDSSNAVTPNLYAKYASGSNVIEIYFSPTGWSKNLIHIQAVSLPSAPTNICENVSSIPTEANRQPTNTMVRMTATPTSGQVVITDGTTGGIKSSGYTIATSVPSGAVFTDTKVTIANTNPTSATTYYPIWYTGTSGTGTMNANDGLKYSSLQGTASASGEGQLLLGNNTSTGTAGNKRGSLVIYSEKNGYVNLRATAASTTARDIYLPDKAGTIALTSDIVTYNFSGSSFVSGKSDTASHDANSCDSNGHYYYTSNGPAKSLGASTDDGALYVQAYSSSWVAQIAQDYRNGRLFVRGKNNGTWQNWVKVALTSDITDTKNTAGSTDTSSKIFLIGATSQAANPQTYSDNEVYVTNGVLTTKKTQIGGTSVTLEYNSSTKSLDFIF